MGSSARTLREYLVFTSEDLDRNPSVLGFTAVTPYLAILLSTGAPSPRRSPRLTPQFWDPRKKGDAVRSYTQHWDYISDFLYFEDKRQLVTTSGDGHLSVIDVRSNKAEPMATSADQEDELLSIVPIKGGTKCVVGTGLGALSIWNRKLGWEDSVDRFIGHPASVDALVPLTDDVVATGSEDGMVRVINILPNRFRESKML